MNTAQTRVLDTVLTNIVWESYKEPDLVGKFLFPYVNILRKDSKVVKFSDANFKILDSIRAPGAKFKAIEPSYSSETVSLFQDGLVAVIPYERVGEAAGIPNLDLLQMTVTKVLRYQYRKLEKEQAELATNTVNYNANNTVTLSGTDQFNDYTNSNPASVIEAAKEQIRRSIGVYPNTAVVSARAFSVLKQHPYYLNQFKYTTSKTITSDMLRDAWELTNLAVGGAVFQSNTTTISDMWGSDIVLAYVNPNAINNTMPNVATDESEPSFGYTYRLMYSPMVHKFRPDEDTLSWKSNVTFDRRTYIVGPNAGYLIKNAVATP